jgi:hypothetical protein
LAGARTHVLLPPLMILQWKGGWFVYDAEHQLQMLGGRCCPASLNFLRYARAAQSVAGVSRLVFHTSIVFPRPEDRFGFAKSNTHTCADRIQLLTFECQNVCQKGFNTIMHRICPDVVPELSGVLTVGRATADYPAMGFNKCKMEDRRRKAAEQEAAARRALGPQIIEDSVKLIEAWNARQAAHIPMLFSPTIEAAQSRRVIDSCGRAARLAAPLATSTCGRSTGTAVRPSRPLPRRCLAARVGRTRRLQNWCAYRSRALPMSITRSAAATGGSTNEESAGWR